MEDALNNNGSNAGVVPAAPPITSSAPMPDTSSAPAAAPIAPSAPIMNVSTPASPYGTQKFDILRDVNWTETLLFGLFGTAFAYVIFYYRFKLKEDKIINSDIQRQLDNQNMRIGKVETGLSHARIAY